jgi:hypothetical protein
VLNEVFCDATHVTILLCDNSGWVCTITVFLCCGIAFTSSSCNSHSRSVLHEVFRDSTHVISRTLVPTCAIGDLRTLTSIVQRHSPEPHSYTLGRAIFRLLPANKGHAELGVFSREHFLNTHQSRPCALHEQTTSWAKVWIRLRNHCGSTPSTSKVAETRWRVVWPRPASQPRLGV